MTILLILVVCSGLGALVVSGFWLCSHATAGSQTTDPFTIHDRQRRAEGRIHHTGNTS